MVHGIEAIFFDAAGTLFRVRGSVGRIYSEFALRHGFQADPARLDENFRIAFAKMPKPGLHGTEREWWLEVVRQTLADYLPSDTLTAYFDDVFDHFRSSDAWQLYPEVPDALTELRNRGFRLGIISNFDSRLRDLVADLGIGPFFEQQTISWETRTPKPDRQIFLSALNRMEIPPSRAIHVGDSIPDDVEGARAAGILPILLDRRGTHKTVKDCMVIGNLAELCRILQR